MEQKLENTFDRKYESWVERFTGNVNFLDPRPKKLKLLLAQDQAFLAEDDTREMDNTGAKIMNQDKHFFPEQ